MRVAGVSASGARIGDDRAEGGREGCWGRGVDKEGSSGARERRRTEAQRKERKRKGSHFRGRIRGEKRGNCCGGVGQICCQKDDDFFKCPKFFCTRIFFYRSFFLDLNLNLARNGLWRMREGVGFNTELGRGGFLGN